jgi:hypothetical protein
LTTRIEAFRDVVVERKNSKSETRNSKQCQNSNIQ